MKKIKMMQQIDQYWHDNGLIEYVPAPWHYTITFGLVIIPFMLLFTCICWMIDESEEKPSYAEDGAASRTTRPDKLD